MFGYIKPFKPELKICEYDAYKAVYCGLCGQLGKSFGPVARLTLSYDFTFLSMLHFSLLDNDVTVHRRGCFVNPFKKIPCTGESESLRLSSDIAVIMLYYKLLDNIADSRLGKAGWICLRPLIAQPHRKAADRRPEAEEIIRKSMRLQDEIEKAKADSLDEAAEPTAAAMSKLFETLSDNGKIRRILSRFGYFVGRFIYICDALDDIEEDIKRDGYNPLLTRFKLDRDSDCSEIGDAKSFAKESLYMTIGEAAKAYELLELNAFKTVLDNIIMLGLRFTADQLFLRDKKERTFI